MDFFTVDTFTTTAYTGNPTAVVPICQPLTEKQMQTIATEMHFSETSFVTAVPSTGDKSDFRNCSQFQIRWFNPINEDFFCGHGTLATAHMLFNEFENTSNSLEFTCLAGNLIVSKEGDRFVMNFPIYRAQMPALSQEELFMRLAKAVAGGNKIESVMIEPSTRYLLVHLEDIPKDDFESLRPDMNALNSYQGSDVVSVMITTRGKYDVTNEKNFDFASRFFAPWIGIPEDQATGSAHTILVPFWAERLGKTEMKCKQMSRRGGELDARLKGDRVELLSGAVTVMAGQIRCI